MCERSQLFQTVATASRSTETNLTCPTMATIGIPVERRGSADLRGEWDSEVCAEGETGPPSGFPQPEIEAPVVEPEEDMEPPEPGAHTTPHGNFKHATRCVADMPETEEVPDGMSQAPEERQESNTRFEKATNQIEEGCGDVEDTAPSSSSRDCLSPKEGWPESAALTLPDGMKGESIFCVREALSEDLTSSDSEDSQDWPTTAGEVDPVETGGELLVKVRENDGSNSGEEGKTALEVKQEDFDNDDSKQHNEEKAHVKEKDEDEEQQVREEIEFLDYLEFEQEMSKASKTRIEPHSEMERSEEVFTMASPPFVGEGEEEGEEQNVDSKPLDISSARRQWVRLDSSSSKPPQPSFSRSSSCSSLIDNTAQGAVTSQNHQGEQLHQTQPEATPRAENQEATQQVFRLGCPSPARVTMEPANQGKAGSQGSGCVVAERDQERRAGGRREGESRQTGGEKGQEERVLDTGKAEDKRQREGGELERRKGDQVACESCFKHNKSSRMDCDSYDDSENDSGVSADFSPGSTMELSSNSLNGATPQAMETPIEREIRRAVQREYSLRRSRGLHNPPTNPEYVEIPLRKSIMSQTLPSKFDKNQGKDRQLAGKKMLKEINMETQREQVLVKLGKVRGVYDKGTVRQLKERQKLFEAFQEPKEYFSTLSPRSHAPSWASTSDLSTLELQDSASTLEGSIVERSQSLDLLSESQSPNPSPRPNGAERGGISHTPARGPGLSEGMVSQVIILENNLQLVTTVSQPTKPTKPVRPHSSAASFPEAEALTVVDSGTLYLALPSMVEEPRQNGKMSKGAADEEEELEEVIPKENPFFKLRSSTALDKVEQDIRAAREREKELRRQRNSLYGGTAGVGGGEGEGVGGGGGRSTVRETQSVTPHQLNGLVPPDVHATPPKTGSGTSTGQQSLGKLGMWPPPPTEEGDVIQPGPPRTPRQRTPLLQRWETGQVNGHEEEED